MKEDYPELLPASLARHLHSIPCAWGAKMSYARKAARYELKPGDGVPESGIYDVIHRNCQSKVIQAVFVAGEPLPECRFCRSRVRFQLHRAMPHISEDRDFQL
jgi:hypothetical protein